MTAFLTNICFLYHFVKIKKVQTGGTPATSVAVSAVPIRKRRRTMGELSNVLEFQHFDPYRRTRRSAQRKSRKNQQNRGK